MTDEIALDRVGAPLGETLVEASAALGIGMTGEDKGAALELGIRKCLSERRDRWRGRGSNFCRLEIEIDSLLSG
jgi:hypothetical protein